MDYREQIDLIRKGILGPEMGKKQWGWDGDRGLWEGIQEEISSYI